MCKMKSVNSQKSFPFAFKFRFQNFYQIAVFIAADAKPRYDKTNKNWCCILILWIYILSFSFGSLKLESLLCFACLSAEWSWSNSFTPVALATLESGFLPLVAVLVFLAGGSFSSTGTPFFRCLGVYTSTNGGRATSSEPVSPIPKRYLKI